MAQTGNHTPGPWSLSEKYHSVNVRAVDGPYVADCNASAAIGWETKQANARLIAAAPTMLAELRRDLAYVLMMKQLLVALRQTETVQYECTEVREAAIRAAIAKAEGR